MQYPTTGGSWSREPVTGALTRIEGPAEPTAAPSETAQAAPEPAAPSVPEEPADAPEKPVPAKKGKS